MVLAIEPMVNIGDYEVELLAVIHGLLRQRMVVYQLTFEHTVAITKDGPKVLTN